MAGPADLLDQAQQIEEQHRAAALARHRARPVGTGAELCIDCDTPIPAARRRALPHADRCIGCQTLYERRL
jgi:phage/conjugal plasmid C-4 type zinc finger TraR family protein